MAGGQARPELTALTGEQRDRVAKHLRRHRTRCAGCGSTDFDIGDALYLGFLFRSERQDAYLVGLTCAAPACPAPRTGVRLRKTDLFRPGEETADGEDPREAGTTP
ncbi:hypothetical protein [Actinomadura sediminis]|uniref:Uncharacterized protein n=1 Tax=Actinomadura sediminis TaxID=1038904 RepID=A0ABW3EG86_9ACTN